MAVTMPDGYYSRFDESKNYERHLYRAGKVLQSAELNEQIEASQNRLRRIADVLFQDGAVIRDAQAIVNPTNGFTTLESGAIYARGAVRGVIPASFTIPVIGIVYIGIYLQDSIVTEVQDPALRDPAVGVRNYSEPGANRLKTLAVWGYQGDGQSGEFYPVYTVVDGVINPNAPPPQIDAVALSIARYDRQSAGGFYVSSGLELTKLDDASTNVQVYTLAEGVARVSGNEIIMPHARTVVYPTSPDLKTVVSEPHAAAGGTERVNTNQGPVSSIDQVVINAQKTATITHGTFSGSSDLIGDSPITSIVSITQGGTTYVQGTDYILTGDSVNWSAASPPAAEPAPGSTYSITYRYNRVATPTAVDSTGFTVTGAVVGTQISVSYKWMRLRYDRLCLTPTGDIVWVKGVAHDTSPLKPMTPPGLLAVASVYQTWVYATRETANDGVRMLPMGQLEDMQMQIDDLFNVVSDHHLRTDIALLDPTTKKGIFVDPFLNDDKRDSGVTQDAAVYDGIMTLPMIGITVFQVNLGTAQTLPLNTSATAPVVQQTLKTLCMKVNPYDAFSPIPAGCVLRPAIDFWCDFQTVWASSITKIFTRSVRTVTGPEWGLLSRFVRTEFKTVVNNTTELVSQRTIDAPFLRQISIGFDLTGFGPGEILNTVRFDGRSVAFTA